MLSVADKEPTTKDTHTSTYSLPLTSQIVHVTKRTLQQYYRTPRYVLGKLMLAIMASLFTGFTFYNQNTSQAGLQNTLFAIFMVTTVFTPLVQQVSIPAIHFASTHANFTIRSSHNSLRNEPFTKSANAPHAPTPGSLSSFPTSQPRSSTKNSPRSWSSYAGTLLSLAPVNHLLCKA